MLSLLIIGFIYAVVVGAGALKIHLSRNRRPPTAATLNTYLVAAGSLLIVPMIGLVIEAIGVAVAIGSFFAAPFTIGATLLLGLAIVIGIILEFVSVGIAVTKLTFVMLLAVSGRISNEKASLLIGTSYFFALMGFMSIGAFGEMAELSEIGDMADLEGLADIGDLDIPDLDIPEIDGDGFGPADPTYGDPSLVDGDPRTSHYVEAYERGDGTWVDGHWKSKKG